MRLLLGILASVLAMAQEHAPGTEKSVSLLAGLGTHSIKITTKSAEAQKFFDQGLNLLYGFNRYESVRSFKKVTELDGAAPMGFLGLGMAVGPFINMDLDGDYDAKASCEAIGKGRQLAAKASARERALADALGTRCPEYVPQKYTAGMKALAAKYPDDLDFQTLYAESLMIPVRWKWWSADGKPAAGTEEAIRVLESVLRRNSNHPGANHLYIHAVEASPSPERAIASAQRLMGIVPAAGHLVHMPGHIWLVLGEWNLAADVNERAAKVDQEYFDKTKVMSGYMGYWVHNMHFIAYARSMQGNYEKAQTAAKDVGAAIGPMVQQMPAMVDAFWPWPIFVDLRFEKWDSILAAGQPPVELKASKAMLHYARGRAFLAKGQRAQAEAELKALREVEAKLPADWVWLNNKSSDVVTIVALALQAELKGDFAAWKEAAERQDRLVYDEPPPVFFPIREAWGGELLKAGKPAEAEAVLRECLRRVPKNARAVSLLSKALEAQGKREEVGVLGVELGRLRRENGF